MRLYFVLVTFFFFAMISSSETYELLRVPRRVTVNQRIECASLFRWWVVVGIAVCDLGSHCVEEAADTTLCLILDMYRRTHWLARDVGFCNRRVTCPEQLFAIAAGATRIRGQTLGIVGFGP